MLGSFVEDKIEGNVESRLTITIEGSGSRMKNLKVSKEVFEPQKFTRSGGHGAVLDSSGIAGYGGLFLKISGDKRLAKENTVA